MSFITILADPSAPFDWQYQDRESGRTYDTVFSLRQLPDDEEATLRARHETTSWRQHQKITDLDSKGYGADVIDAVILGWANMKARAKDGTLSDIPCTRAFKLALPEKIKAEIIRVTLGREAGLDYKS